MISMLKVLKFGGSSLADAHQFAKVKSIVDADPARRVVIVSAPGKRFSGDHKITDLLYLCAAHIKYGVSCEDIFAMIRDRYNEIIVECGLKLSLDKEFDELWEKMKNGISQDELASRGEYFSARLMAEYLATSSLMRPGGSSSSSTAPSIRRPPMQRCAPSPRTVESSSPAFMA